MSDSSEFELYAQRHEVYDIMQSMMQELLKERPGDPLTFMQQFLLRPLNRICAVLHGLPAKELAPLVGKLEWAQPFLTYPMHGSLTHRTISYIQAQQVSDSLNLVHVNAETLLPFRSGAEATPGTDELVCHLVKQRVDESDAQKRGWLLTFGSVSLTRSLCLALQSSGVLPTHFVSLSNDNADHECHESFRSVLQQSKPSAEAVRQVLCTRAPSKAPHSFRVVLYGSPGSGRSTIGKWLADKYNLVYVSSGQLIRQAVASDSAASRAYAEYVSEGQLIPDEAASELVIKRLGQSDVRARGFVLDGFPATQAQAEALEKSGLGPLRVIELSLSDAEVLVRLTERRLDSKTGKEYHVSRAPAPSEKVARRFVQRPGDNAPYVQERLSQHHRHRTAIIDGTYGGMAEKNASGRVQCVAVEHRSILEACEAVEALLVRPLPVSH